MLDTPVDLSQLDHVGPDAPGPGYISRVALTTSPRSGPPTPMSTTRIDPAIEQRMIAARPRLVRLARLRGVPREAADDVAQDTLLEALRMIGTLRDPDRLDAWLDAICRNICRRWARKHTALSARQQPLGLLRSRPEGEGDAEVDMPNVQAFDLEDELTRQELATILDRALAHLHPSAREPLVLHYVVGLPASEIATRMGLATSAVEVRLHRARRELRRVLAGALRAEVEALELQVPYEVTEGHGQRETSIWCPLCAQRHLVAEINRTTGYIRFSCLLCGQLAQATSRDLLAGVRSSKPILSRLLTWLTDRYTRGLDTGETPCTNCGRIARAEPLLPAGVPAEIIEQVGDVPLMHLRCPMCGLIGGADIARLTVDRRETQRFWREHPRIRVLPPRDVETAGVSAVVMRVESATDGASLDLIWARETLRVLGVHGEHHTG